MNQHHAFTAIACIGICLLMTPFDAAATNRDDPKQQQEQDQKQYQKQDQDQYQGQEQSLIGGDNSITLNEAKRPDDITIRNTPSVYAPPASPTSPCRIGGSGGASGAGIGFSLGGSKMDWECNTRETADAFARMGMPALGLMMLCRTEAITKELGKGGAGFSSEDCEEFVRNYQKQPTGRDVQQDIELNALRHKIALLEDDAERCREETDEKIDRAFETCVGK